LVRPNGRPAQERLINKVRSEATRYGVDIDAYGLTERVSAVEWDITNDAATCPNFDEVDTVWHSAASLKYKDRDRPEIFQHNVEGTRNMLDVAKRNCASSFAYISTAYVCGPTSGKIVEARRPHNGLANNVYEQSKLLAEGLIFAQDEVPATILRPTIVVGHSKTFASSSSFGIYGFFDQLDRLALTSRAKMGGYFQRNSIKVIADPGVPLNIVPVDFVATAAVDIVTSELSPWWVAHISNMSPPTVGDVMDAAFACKGLKGPQYVKDKTGFSVVDGEFDRHIDFYKSYIVGKKYFSQGALSQLGRSIAVAYTPTMIERLYRTYEQDVV
jgi:nucleoside-diphosphate-sugar epimerase